MTITGLAAVGAATERVSTLSTCGAAAAAGGDPCPGSAAMSLVSADKRGAAPLLLLLPALSLPMARVSCSHGSVQKAKFNFPGITEEPEPALTA